ncbi:MAG: glutamate racemase [candidate division FCPU426 bacterium]
MNKRTTPSKRHAPVGVFDSGVGGLTVMRAIRRALPAEHLVYLGDTARTPYGSKAGETVVRFTRECVNRLLRFKIKALVVACNTASAYSLPILRRALDLPILGVVQPGARAAVAVPEREPIGVIGTRATVNSQAYPKTIDLLKSGAKVYSQACPLLVPLVEEGWLQGEVSERIVRIYLAPLLKKRVRSLILGCTHYPALKPVIRRVCGSRVRIIDSAEEVAKELRATLEKEGLMAPGGKGREHFLVTDVPEKFIQVGARLWGGRIGPVRRTAV